MQFVKLPSVNDGPSYGVKSAFVPRRVERPSSPLTRHMSDWEILPVAISLSSSHRRSCCCPPTVGLPPQCPVSKSASPLVTRPSMPLLPVLRLAKQVSTFSIFSTICIAHAMPPGRGIRCDAWKTGQKVETKEIPTASRSKLLGRCRKPV